MQERVTAKNGEGLRTSDIIVQYNPELQSVGLGLEPTKEGEIPGQLRIHFIDAIYGYRETQIQIGKLFLKNIEHLGFTIPDLDSYPADEEAQFLNNLGRDVLDSVIATKPDGNLWTWLDRPAVNRLIRLLRKARDFSFGKDE